MCASMFTVLFTALLMLGRELGIAWSLSQVYVLPHLPTPGFLCGSRHIPLLTVPLPSLTFFLLPLHLFSCRCSIASPFLCKGCSAHLAVSLAISVPALCLPSLTVLPKQLLVFQPSNACDCLIFCVQSHCHRAMDTGTAASPPSRL